MILCKLGSAYSGVVPQESVAQRGIDKGQARLRVPVFQVKGTVFLIKVFLLLLPKPVKMLVISCVKDDACTVVLTVASLYVPVP